MEELQKVIEGLRDRFERLPTDNEVYRFIYGGPEMRQKIWTNKGLPANQR